MLRLTNTASKLASTYFSLFYRSVHVLYTEKCVPKPARRVLRRHIKPTQSQMSLVVSDIVLKNTFAIKRYETVLYTCNI